MNANTAEVCKAFLLAGLLAFFVAMFAGDPDLHDALIERISGHDLATVTAQRDACYEQVRIGATLDPQP